MKTKNFSNQFFYLSLLTLVLGIINVNLSLFGFICIFLPFLLFKKFRKNIWCSNICPRRGLLYYTKYFNLGLTLPKFIKDGSMKKYVFKYFIFNLSIATLSTIMVGIGRVMPIDNIRFLIIFKMPFELFQIFDYNIAPVLTHLSYRIYSMFFTSIAIGLGFGILFKPITWCQICPIPALIKEIYK